MQKAHLSSGVQHDENPSEKQEVIGNSFCGALPSQQVAFILWPSKYWSKGILLFIVCLTFPLRQALLSPSCLELK